MSVDLQDSVSSAQDKIRAAQSYQEIKKTNDDLKRKRTDNEEQDKDKTTSPLENFKEQKKRFQRQVKSQMDNMMDIAKSSSSRGPETARFIKSVFIRAAQKVEPKLYSILMDEAVKTIGCSQQQVYITSQTFYLKLPSLDLFKILLLDPEEIVGKTQFEPLPPQKGQIPYSMNRELWLRIQNQNQSIEYFGKSGQKLFDFSYQRTNGVITGDYYKIQLSPRDNSKNKIIDFLADYYKSIRIVDMNNIFQSLIDIMLGSISLKANIGFGEVAEKNKTSLFLQRIFGLCFDGRKEIDVTGNAKVAELDGVDDSFFELTDVDLRFIDRVTNNMRNGVVEFEECENVLLPIDNQAIIDEIIKIGQVTNLKDQEALISNLTSVIANNEQWKALAPNINLQLTLDNSFTLNIPKAIVFAILSPKVLFPIYLMLANLNNYNFEGVEGSVSFLKIFKRFSIQMASRIGAIFVEELYNIIKKDILRLLQSIQRDMERDAVLKRYAYIAYLVELILIVIKLIVDWRQCKSVIDEILMLLNLASRYIKSQLPPSLVAGAELLPGFSPSRAMMSTIEEMQKLGLPTGPMPSGAPNLYMQQVFAQIQGSDSEGKNRKVQVFVKPLTITPAGITLPAGNIFGVVM